MEELSVSIYNHLFGGIDSTEVRFIISCSLMHILSEFSIFFRNGCIKMRTLSIFMLGVARVMAPVLIESLKLHKVAASP